MNYNDRVTIITDIKAPGYLDDEVVDTEKVVVPCHRSDLSNDEQMGIFGKYNQAAFKLHMQGTHKGFSSIKYAGLERSVYSTRYHRNSTVVVLT